MDNYYVDRRVMAANHQSMFKSIDSNQMKAVVKYSEWDDEDDTEIIHEIEMPIKWEVCGLCNGRGAHVNPNIDYNGLTAEDFAEDPDFAENYFSGRYDQTCNECCGRTTVPVIDNNCLTKEQKSHLENIEKESQEQAEYERLLAWERRMGL
jgi:hypothetical protein